MKPINWRIIAHPVNWITVLLMLVIAGIGGHFVLAFLGHDPSNSNGQYSKKQAA
jgi:hypothetical protein